jgi:hypothetical protein
MSIGTSRMSNHTTIPNILKWTKRMQAPIYDPIIDNWKREQKISDFIFENRKRHPKGTQQTKKF